MLILTELDAHGNVVMDHGAIKSYNVSVVDSTEVRNIFKDRAAYLNSTVLPNVKFAIVTPSYKVLWRAGEPIQPC